MKIVKQIFCQCGKGRAFLRANRKQAFIEWVADLEANGWRFSAEHGTGSEALACNVCSQRTHPDVIAKSEAK